LTRRNINELYTYKLSCIIQHIQIQVEIAPKVNINLKAGPHQHTAFSRVKQCVKNKLSPYAQRQVDDGKNSWARDKSYSKRVHPISGSGYCQCFLMLPYQSHQVLPPETNIALKNRPPARKLVFQPSIFTCNVSFREGNCFSFPRNKNDLYLMHTCDLSIQRLTTMLWDSTKSFQGFR